MNAAQLLAHFDRLAEAPNAVPRLRRLILDLAVRGKLVEQDARDEPAAELLNRIKLNSMQSVTSGKPHKVKPLSPIAIYEEPYPAPRGWSWVRMGLIGETNIGLTYSPANLTMTGTPVLRSSNVQDGKLDLSDLVRVDSDVKDSVLVGEGDLLICARNGSKALVGKTALISGLSERMAFGAFMAIFRSPYNAYLLRFINSPLFRTMISEVNTTTINQITQENLKSALLPFPPLAEQHRIVAKVDELMALCDQLETAQHERERRRDCLAAASLQRLNQPAADATPATQLDHARFHLHHLPRLTTRPEHIKAMRQLFLDLAVRGKLLRQDSNDEPAAELLRKIQQEKLKQLGNRKKDVALSAMDLGSVPFELPSGWAWAHFPEVGTFGRGKSKHRPRNDPSLFDGGTHFLVQTGDVARSKGVIKTFTSKYNDIGLAQSMKWPAGTLCITIAANIADSGILSFDACFPDSVVGFKASPLFDSARYFEYFVRTAKANLLAFAPATAQKNINLEILNAVLIPLPPLAEQHRIVAKVDELMFLCDQLEAQLAATQTGGRRLLEAVLKAALAPA